MGISVHFVVFVVPMGILILPWEIRVAFPQGKPAATESRYPNLINYDDGIADLLLKFCMTAFADYPAL